MLSCTGQVKGPEPINFVSFTTESTYLVYQNQEDTIRLEFQIREGFHIMSHNENNQHIATCIIFDQNENILVGAPVFPKPEPYQMMGVEDVFDSFKGQLTILLPLKIKIGAPAKECSLAGILKYQACDDRKCFFHRELPFSVLLKAMSS